METGRCACCIILYRWSIRSYQKSLDKSRQKKQDAIDEAKKLVAEVIPDEEDQLLVEGVAELSKQTAKSEVSLAKGPERWAKRVQGLQPPSKLLKFSFVRTLGIGNFAEVMLVENRKGELTVLKESDKLPEAANEISILSRVRSPHVVQIQQYFIEEIGHRHFAYIEMEFCDGGDLRGCWRQRWVNMYLHATSMSSKVIVLFGCRAGWRATNSTRCSASCVLD